MSLITFTVLFFTVNLDSLKGKSTVPLGANSSDVTVSHTKTGKPRTVITVDSAHAKNGISFSESDTTIKKSDSYFIKKARNALKNVIDYANENPNGFLKTFLERYIHSLPKSLFVCMPLFALLIALFYIKRKKYFTEHAIFTLHYHVHILFWIFVLLLLSNFFNAGLLFTILFFYIIFYQYKALQNVYHGKRWINIIKSISIFLLYYVIVIFVQLIFLVYSLATISK